MNADIRQMPARCQDTLADIEGSGQPNNQVRWRRSPPRPGKIHHPPYGVPIGVVD
jgi:hypothetical protein